MTRTPRRLKEHVRDTVSELPIHAARLAVMGVGRALLLTDRVRKDYREARESGLGPVLGRLKGDAENLTGMVVGKVSGNGRTEEEAPTASRTATDSEISVGKPATAGTTRPPATKPPTARPAAAKPAPTKPAATKPAATTRPAPPPKPAAAPPSRPAAESRPKTAPAASATTAKPKPAPGPKPVAKDGTPAKPKAAPKPKPSATTPPAAKTPAPKASATKTPAPKTPAPKAPAAKAPTPKTPAAKAPAPKAPAAKTPAAKDLPVSGYDEATLASVRARLRGLDARQVGELRDYERTHAARADFLRMYENRIDKLRGER